MQLICVRLRLHAFECQSLERSDQGSRLRADAAVYLNKNTSDQTLIVPIEILTTRRFTADTIVRAP